MKSLTGRVKKLTHQIDLNGFVVTTFKILNTTVKVSLKDKSEIEENDEITVAGEERNKIFFARALRNISKNNTNVDDTTTSWLTAVSFLVIGILLLPNFVGFILIFASLVFFDQIYLLHKALRLLS
ncbi:hypothetical protein L0B53_13835 [Vibrio sp. SS-MA-C1-2]|uniref:hypothetical protein n=1 Tax=Vibrio sp. SS-MA-C1-2 TaxID=2908646 RepID=UPI001F2774BB|nr:hypothetical protein [Vibrio sp. SS-MA-C1-2]UJF18094.1 hypothetical protein L0B53_13835 [Vibrio sp. SS-MA-C1-2]